MAKKNKSEDSGEIATEGEKEGEAKQGRGRKVFLASGEARVDFIRRRYFEDGAKRGDIARELSELTGQTVPYQIVFAATKKEPVAEGEGDGDGETAEATEGEAEAA